MVGLSSLWIISSSGSLIYKKDFGKVPPLSETDVLIIGSIFFSQHIISKRWSPVPNSTSGFETIETDEFR
ncbi:MAG: hypothetical protein EZS28_028101, partial [Streblomastix strix]